MTDSVPLIHPTFAGQILEPGQPLTLECVASGTPMPEVKWMLDGEELVLT